MNDALIALDLATDRAREAEAEVRRRQLERELRAAQGWGLLPRRPSLGRRLLAAPIRLTSNATHGFSELTCTLATRIEGRTA